MADRLFGTDGVRGLAGVYPLDRDTIERLGAALVRTMSGQQRPTLLVGRDTRESSAWIEAALARGACAAAAEVTSAGVLPTPAIACLTRKLGFDAGVVISASHNPYRDNGIKVFSGAGEKFSERHEAAVEAILADRRWAVPSEVVVRIEHRDLSEMYLHHVRQVLPDPSPLAGSRLVVDCANGATTTVAPRFFRELGFDVTAVACSPDGRNINDGCGSTHPQALARRVVAERARLGVAFDGDGDRAIFVDDQGHLVNGDAVLLLAATYLKRQGRLRGNAVVATVMSNMGLEIGLREIGVELLRCPVGDKYVMEEMNRRGLALGGEQSGHIIFAEYLYTGDGLITALAVLRAMGDTGRSLAEMAGELTTYPQVLINVPVREKRDLERVPELMSTVRQVEAALGGRGRLLVRYSGTEPLLRVMIEGQSQGQIQAWADEIAAEVRRHLG